MKAITLTTKEYLNLIKISFEKGFKVILEFKLILKDLIICSIPHFWADELGF